MKKLKWLLSALANGWRLNIIYFISESKTRSLSVGGRALCFLGFCALACIAWIVISSTGLFWTLNENKSLKSELEISQELLFNSQMKHDKILDKIYGGQVEEPKAIPAPSNKVNDSGNISKTETNPNAG